VRVRLSRILAQSATVLACCAAAAIAQTPPEKAAAVYLHRGADRDQRLLEGARREGSVVLYTSLATSESVPLTQAFQKKTGVKVQLWRSLSENVLQRTVTEARAHRYAVDVVETNSPELEALARERLTSEFFSPYVAKLPAWAIPANRQWIGDRMELFVVAYNTAKVRREELPATYEGFLDPRWKGRIGIEATDQEWIAALAGRWGEKRALDFFRKLAAMGPDVRKGHVLLAELVSAGEVPVCLTAYHANVQSMRRRGRPIDWAPVQPMVGRPQGLVLAKDAPHPNAALLFADFVLSPEGQQMLESMGRIPALRGAKSALDGLDFVMVDPAVAIGESDKWQKIWNEILKK